MMIQIILHLIGDYITQSHWMATHKTKHSDVAAIHAMVYSAPFLLIGPWGAVLVIALTHFLVDRFRLARYVVYAKNCLGYPIPKWENCKATGYDLTSPEIPLWLAVWLMIIADNTIHLACNYAALRFIR